MLKLHHVRSTLLCVGIMVSMTACKRTNNAVPADTEASAQAQPLAEEQNDTVVENVDEEDGQAAELVLPAAPDISGKPFTWSIETIGPLQRKMSGKEVEERIGAPESKSDPEESPATGEILAWWLYPKHGMSLTMAYESEDAESPALLQNIHIDGSSTLKTSRGIGMGSSLSEVIAAYQDVKDPDQEGESIVYDDERIVVGSIYGGVMINLEDGVVTSIFLGQGAE